jgi:hypothetical protein
MNRYESLVSSVVIEVELGRDPLDAKLNPKPD